MAVDTFSVDQVAVALFLACLAESRTNDEQAALLVLAARVDRAMNKHAGSNPRWRAFEEGRVTDWEEVFFEMLANETRVLDPNAGETHVRTSWERKPEKAAKRRAMLDREVAEVLAARAEGRRPRCGSGAGG